MKIKALLLILVASISFCNVYSQSVTLSAMQDEGYINCPGTTTVSGSQSVVYGYKDRLRAADPPYTFYSTIYCSYGFENHDKGRGRILNVNDKTARIKVTCIDGERLASDVLILDIAPRTFSRIMFQDRDEYTKGVVRKIRCELIKLY